MRRHSSAHRRPGSEANSFAMPASMSERWPASFMRAAWRVSRRAASTWVAMSASLNWIALCSGIGLSQGAVRQTDAAGGDVDPAELQRIHHLRKPLVQPRVLAAEDRLGGRHVAVE